MAGEPEGVSRVDLEIAPERQVTAGEEASKETEDACFEKAQVLSQYASTS